MTLALLAALALAAAPPAPARDRPGTHHVAPRPGAAVIAAAVAAASAGDTIVLGDGIYREPTILVDRPLTILAHGRATVDGEGARTLFRVVADDVVLRGLRLRAVGASHTEDRAAIRVERAARCVVAGNAIDDAFFGVYLSRTTGCVVEGNVIAAHAVSESSAGNGIHVFSSADTRVVGNRVRGHRDGIYLEFASGTLVRDNVSEGNARYGLHFMSAHESRYEGNTFRRNHAGVAVMYSRGVRMHGNHFADHWGSAAYGLLLKEITDGELTGNTFDRNTTAVLADGANRLVARDNRFRRNGWAVRLLASSSGARFTRNTFVGNTFDVSTNSRQVSSTFDGNYWDAYRGYDLDRDGRGDVPHRPVRLFSLVVERTDAALLLLHSSLVRVLDATERVVPSLTPAALADESPLMRRPT